MSNVRVFALGGLDESGRNMYCVEQPEGIIAIEAGLKYPDTNQLGIEIIIPDFSYLVKNKDRFKGIVITHGHDDVMSALPYLLKQVNVPIYTTALTAKIIQAMLKKMGIKDAKINIIKRNSEFRIHNMNAIAFGTTHSIADSFGIAIETPDGYVCYSSEFVVDTYMFNPNYTTNLSLISEIGKKGVLCLLSESQSAGKVGYTSPSHRITKIIEPVIENAPGRVIVTAYAQNFLRITEIIDVANKLKKRVFIYDQQTNELIKYNEELGYYKVPMGCIMPSSVFNNNIENIVILVTGNGHKIFREMNRIIMKEDDIVKLQPNDTVIIASPVVQGTEVEAGIMENELYKEDLNVVSLSSKNVNSMHPSSDDLKMMMYLLNPRYYIPVKGEYRQLIDNAHIATEMNMTPDKIIVMDNGQVATFTNGSLTSCVKEIALEDILIDGDEGLDVTGFVLKDREALSTDGVIVIGIVCDFASKKIICGPDVQSRGVFYIKDADYIVKNIADIIVDTINEAVDNNNYDNSTVRQNVKEKIQKYVLKETGKRPMILPAILEINLPKV